MRPPIVDFTTFNRMGASVRSLSSLLASPEDFELHIVDNASADQTVNWIRTIKDPRLKTTTFLPRNLGSVAAANLTLSRRAKGQDYIRLENDTVVHTRNFVSMFRAVASVFDVGSLQATIPDHDLPWPDGWQFSGSGLSFYPSLHMAHFIFIRGRAMDRLGFWDEAAGFGDQDLIPRIARGLGMKTGYTDSVQTTVLGKRGYGVNAVNCAGCRLAQNTCRKADAWCFRFDPRGHPGGLHGKALEAGIPAPGVTEQRLTGKLPLYCGSAWKGTLEPWEAEAREKVCEFYASAYEEHLELLMRPTEVPPPEPCTDP